MPAEQIDLHALFNAAIAFDSSEEQASFLEEACGSNPALRQRIDALLRAHSEAGGFFGGKSPVPVTTEIRVTAETVGASIGPYKLLDLKQAYSEPITVEVSERVGERRQRGAGEWIALFVWHGLGLSGVGRWLRYRSVRTSASSEAGR